MRGQGLRVCWEGRLRVTQEVVTNTYYSGAACMRAAQKVANERRQAVHVHRDGVRYITMKPE